MSRVLRRILSIWFYILFVLFYVTIFPFHVILLGINKRWAHDLSHRLNTLWGYVITAPVGVFIRTYNRGKVDSKGVYIFAPNHSSYLDIPICNIAIKNSFRYIGKAELNRIPLFGYMFKRLHISVNRGSVTDSYRSFIRAKDKLKEGTSILIYPEATIPNKDEVILLRFKDGAFRLAIENDIPIVPVTIIGADRALKDDPKVLIRPTTVRVIFGNPIETKDMDVSESSALKDRVRAEIWENLTGEQYAHWRHNHELVKQELAKSQAGT